MTVPGMWAIEKLGRRRLLLIGAAGMLICEYLVAIIGITISTTNIAGQKVLIALVCIYIAFFASTWGPIAWVVTGEIYPLNICVELALELWYRLRHSLPRQPG